MNPFQTVIRVKVVDSSLDPSSFNWPFAREGFYLSSFKEIFAHNIPCIDISWYESGVDISILPQGGQVHINHHKVNSEDWSLTIRAQE